MSNIRIAILIFLVGASLWNVVSASEKHAGVPAHASDFYSRSSINANHYRINADMWKYEVIIITIAGIAWFLIPKRSAT